MIDIVLESLRAAIMLGLVSFLVIFAKRRKVASRKGWSNVLTGFALLLFACVLDVTDNFDALNKFVVIGDTEVEAVLEKFVGYLGGFWFVTIGLVRWLPTVNQLEVEIRERKKAEDDADLKSKQLEQALVQEKKFSALQKEFVSLVSHEFRTPLSIIDVAAQRVTRRRNEITAEELKNRATKIRSAVKRMTGLIDKTLYLSRLDDGKIAFVPVSLSLKDLISGVCNNQAEISPDHDIHFDTAGLPKHFVGDPALLEQVFSNLLSNAVKYSPGGCRIDAKGQQDNDQVLISVYDNGMGISKEELPRMFERFFRAKATNGIPGTGIGLSLCKKFVDMHGGGISVDSVEGRGATFTVQLPIEENDQLNLSGTY